MATVTTREEFNAAIAGGDPSIFVANDITLVSPTDITYSVSLTAAEGASLFWSPQSPTLLDMFVVDENGSLTLGSLILDAQNGDGTLVQLNGGTLTMNEGAVLKGVRSTTSHRAVTVGNLTSTDGGTFIMDGGLITENSVAEAVFCSGGTVIMNNSASISGNSGSGITVTCTLHEPDMRGRLVMTGSSTISNNSGTQAGACIIFGSDLIMGVNEGDAPSIKENVSPFYGGGVVATEDSTIAMGFEAEISGNSCQMFGGGIVANQSNVTLSGFSSIKNNVSSEDAGGIVIMAPGATLTMEGYAEVCGNESPGIAGGMYITDSASLIMKGSASVHGNKAMDGAGIYLDDAVATIGADNSSPSVYENEASNFGGGILVLVYSILNLTGQTSIYGNTAIKGKGVYKMGEINVSRAPIIEDGLFFDDLSAMSAYLDEASYPFLSELLPPFLMCDSVELSLLSSVSERERSRDVYPLSIGAQIMAYQEKDCDNKPFITDVLIQGADIQLELSEHVSPPNVPLVIAERAGDYELLCEADRAAWQIPPEFGPGYSVILSSEQTRALIDEEVYNITYYHLNGAENPNPQTFTISSLPIVLKAPGEREGYVFKGWYDGEGNLVTEITADVLDDIVLIAAWKKVINVCLKFEGNAPCVYDVPVPICVKPGERVRIPHSVPLKPDHCFVGWNTEPLGTGKWYAPNDTILLGGANVTLYAQWMPLCGRYRAETLYCPKRRACCRKLT